MKGFIDPGPGHRYAFIGKPIAGQSKQPFCKALTGGRSWKNRKLHAPGEVVSCTAEGTLHAVHDMGVEGAMNRETTFDELFSERFKICKGLPEGVLADRKAVVEERVNRLEHLLLEVGEIDDEAFFVQRAGRKAHFEFPGMPMKVNAGPRVAPDMVGKTDVHTAMNRIHGVHG